MRELHWSIGSDLPAEDVRLIGERVLSHGRALASDGNAQPFACLVRQDGVVVAGGAGRIEYGRLFVHSLWVDDALRSQGLGTRVLHALEREASVAGCSSALLETLSDRAVRLYERCGYERIAVVLGYVGPFTRYILLKHLSGSSDA